MAIKTKIYNFPTTIKCHGSGLLRCYNPFRFVQPGVPEFSEFRAQLGQEIFSHCFNPQLPWKQTWVPRIDRHRFKAIIRNDALIFQLDHVISANLAH